MPKSKLPLYAIVELLIRLSAFNTRIGNYKNHAERGDEVIVKTTNGTIPLSKMLVLSQFHSPDDIETRELARIAARFKVSA